MDFEFYKLMFLLVIAGCLGSAALALLVGRLLAHNSRQYKDVVPCPHGHENWEDCPVCGH